MQKMSCFIVFSFLEDIISNIIGEMPRAARRICRGFGIMYGMAEVSKSPRRLYSVVRNLEWAFPATFVLGIVAVPFWSADMYAGMALSLTAVALAFGLLRPRRMVLARAALWHGSLVGGGMRTLAFQAEIADADRVVIRKGGGG